MSSRSTSTVFLRMASVCLVVVVVVVVSSEVVAATNRDRPIRHFRSKLHPQNVVDDNDHPRLRPERTATSSSSSPTEQLLIAVILPMMTPSSSSIGGDKPKVDWGFSVERVRPAIEVALQRVVADGLLRPSVAGGAPMVVRYSDSRCDIATAINELFKLHQSDHVNAVFGPCCDYAAAPVARQIRFWDVPMITAGAMADEFSTYKTGMYPLLTRIGSNFSSMAKMIVQLLEHFAWQKVKLLFTRRGQTDVMDEMCHMAASAVYNTLKQNGNFTQRHLSFDDDRSIIDKLLETELGGEFAVVVLCANAHSVREIMITAAQKNFDNGDYVFFNIDLFGSKSQLERPWYRANDTDERNNLARRGFQALKTITLRKPDSKEYKNFSDEVKRRAGSDVYGDEDVNSFVGAFHDAVILYALAVNETLAAELNPRNGTEITRRMWNRSFQGITGNVTIDEKGDRNVDYSLLDMDPTTGRFEVVGNYFGSRLAYEPEPLKQIHWAGNRTSPPPDTPACGFDNAKCQPFPRYAIALIVVGSMMLIGLAIAFVVYRKEKLRKELAKIEVKWSEISPVNNSGEIDTRQAVHSRPSLMNLNSNGFCDYADLNEAIGERQQQWFTTAGVYKMRTVAIKTIPHVPWCRKLALQCKKMKDLQHDHIIRFIGICTDRPSILTEYCSRGSLMDVLEDEKLKLDDMFKLSLIQDIVMGMIYLHNSDIRSHGNLKSSNCVVDSRFVLKITDFGLHSLRHADGCNANFSREENVDYSDYFAKLWTAPELIRSETYPLYGSQKGDVYSFAVICHEIVMRKGPFWRRDVEFDPEEIYWLLRDDKEQLIRPTLVDESLDSFTNRLNRIIRQCWQEKPEDRPEFHAVKTMLRRIRPDGQPELNLLDNLLKRMEQYANNLESLVEARTIDFLKQKKRAEDLLYQMLPRSVANELLETNRVKPVRYEQVTIYFSDIVTFTNLSNESTPEEIVALLDDLYCLFDTIIGQFDVYKVETIGDAYMVVSGLPELNGDLHAREIGRMALALLDAVDKFVIRHRPTTKLQLRIGLHSGSVCACVVGTRMPRYCLVGDTVNTASRMESTGKPLRIHVSPWTYSLLTKFTQPKFQLRPRKHLIKPKGLGEMQTWYLEGVEGENEIRIADTDAAAATEMCNGYVNIS